MLSVKEALNNSSMNSQSAKNEKRGFPFSYKINDSTSLILVAHSCAAGTSELIRGSLNEKRKHRITLARPGNRYHLSKP
jgi:hypothetical protein